MLKNNQSPASKHHQNFMLKSDLSEKQNKYCDCLMDVAAKQPETCLTEKKWFQNVEGKRCANPYAICAKSTGGSTRNCSQYYDFDAMTDQQLITYSHLHGKEVSYPFNRQLTLENIKTLKLK